MAQNIPNIIALKVFNEHKIIKIQLYPDKAPNHVQRIRELTQEKFYNGSRFHRVIDKFMVQTGANKEDSVTSSTKPNLLEEFNDIKHTRGILSMARAFDMNSANSQFFIMLNSAPHLDGQYTAFGKVIEGIEIVDQIKKGDTNKNGIVINPDSIDSMDLIYQ